MPTITVTKEELQKSAQKFQKQLLMVPMISAEATLKHMTPHLNMAGPLTIGELTGDAELGPWKSNRKDEGNFAISGRTLDPHLGNTAIPFDPVNVWGTIYGSSVLKGDQLKNVDIAKQILAYVSALLGKKLNMALWKAKRNPSGDKTIELFDGFDTITTAEISAGNIAALKHNYKDVDKITGANAVDIIEGIAADLAPEMLESPCKMYMPTNVYTAYNNDYRERFGALPYNREYAKTFVEGTNDMLELVPLASKTGSEFIHVAPKSNMHYGCGSGKYPGETLGVEKYESWRLTLEAAMAFCVQFETLAPERLFVAKMAQV